jgi:hypothetical protein
MGESCSSQFLGKLYFRGGREEEHKGREEGERHYGLPQQRKGNHRVSREEQALPHQWTRREEGHEGREDMKGGRTRREGGHEGRKCDRTVPPPSSAAAGYFPSHMALP